MSWVAVLESVPDIDLVAYLPELLDGLLALLSDPNRCGGGGGGGPGEGCLEGFVVLPRPPVFAPSLLPPCGARRDEKRRPTLAAAAAPSLSLSDLPSRSEIRVAAHRALTEFLVEIQASRSADWAALAAVLVGRATGAQVRGGRRGGSGGGGCCCVWWRVLGGTA